MRSSRLRNMAALIFLVVVMSLKPARAQNCGDIYNQGGCGCSGWITINYPGASQGWCENSDVEGCAQYACASEGCGGSVGYMDDSCSSNQYSAWYGFKCNPNPCER